MTRLPTETWLIRPRPDLGSYELNLLCAVCGDTPVEDHHIFRRSLDPGLRECWWVELPDGAVVPHRVGLCGGHHRPVTENQAQLVLEADKTYVYVDVVDVVHVPIQVGPLPPTKGKKCSKCKGAGVEPPAPEKKVLEPTRAKTVKSIRVPKDSVEGEVGGEDGWSILTDLIEQYRVKISPEMGWKPDVPDYYVLVAALVQALEA